MNRILLINPFGVGDVLFTTPVISALRRAYPDSYIGYICNRRTKEILEFNPHLNSIFVFEKDEYRDWWRKSKLQTLGRFLDFFAKIKREKFDIAIDFSLGHQYSFFLMLAGVKTRVGFDYRRRGRFLTNRIKIDGYNQKHVVQYYIDLLRYLNLELDKGAQLEFYINEEDKKWAQDFLDRANIAKGDLLIGVIPGGGTSWGEEYSYRHWPKGYFVRLTRRFAEGDKTKVILFGGKSDIEICDYIIREAGKKIISVCGKTNLRQFAALISYMHLAVCNDGGPLHVAVARGVKTVSIFGPVDEKVYGPYPPGKNHIVINKDLDCRPCYRNFRLAQCRRDRACLRDITVDEVYQAAGRLL